MTTTARELVDTAWRRGMAPDPSLTVSEWADRHRVLSQKGSPEPGQWSTDRTPYLREIMDALSPSSSTERVVFMKSAQIGGTEAALNLVGYIIDMAPGPAMLVQPTVEMAKRVSKQRVDALISESPRLRGKVRPARERDSGNTVLQKDFPGGTLILTGANSAVGLRSMPVRFLILDEVDGYPPDADGEGDPVNLAIARTSNFLRRKVLSISTPSVDGASRIQDGWEESDKRHFDVPCPQCGELQPLQWNRVNWTDLERPPERAAYVCVNGCVIEHREKIRMLAGGRWRATADGDGKTAGFHVSALYSPWLSWGELAQQFLQAKGSAERLKTFVNTMLGETFADVADAPDWERLQRRAESYKLGTVPAGGVILTAGADVQDDRIEVEIVAWGPDAENWSVDHRVLMGRPDQSEVWRQLDQVLAERFPHEEGGDLQILRLCVDTGGHYTADVLAWSARQDPSRVMAIQGRDSLSMPVGSPTLTDIRQRDGKRKRRGGRIWPVGVSLLKGRLYSWLASDPPTEGEEKPYGLCHFPAYDAEYFKQLTAERKVKRKTRQGYIRFEWQKVRERNEVLDCRAYAMAAMETLRLDRWTDQDWQAARANLTGDRPTAAEKPRVRKSSWLDR